MTRPTVDWERIEAQYRAGAMSLRAIASEHGIAESAIRKRAKRDSWERDLTEKVKQKVRRELVRIEVRKQTRTSESTVRTENEEVERAARGPIAAISRHRMVSARSLDVAETLLDQITDAIGSRETFQRAIEDLTKDDKTSARFNALMRAVALPTHIVALKDLGLAMRTLTAIERQAYGLAEVEDPTPPDTKAEFTPSEEALNAARERMIQRLKGNSVSSPDAPRSE